MLTQAGYECQTQKPKGGNHENLLSSKNLDRLPRDKLVKKYRLCPQVDHKQILR